MRTANWRDYELIDASNGERLERWGNVVLIRPDPQVIWNTPKENLLWKHADARYIRSKSGGGNWEVYGKIPKVWNIRYGELNFGVKPMGFKHTGVFPEQAVNWDLQADFVKRSGRQLNVLNLFAYTGGATLALLRAGAKVCHVDASKGMVSWAKENAALSGLSDRPVRWIVDDCVKFVEREIRRGHKYDGIVMDPPSYGRGPSGEVWRLEDQVFGLVNLCANVLADDAAFFMINSYTTGLSPSVMEYILNVAVKDKFKFGKVTSGEIGIEVKSTGFALPCGSTAFFTGNI